MNNPPSTYKLLIFDWDGTLIDSVSRIVNCLRSATLEHGYNDRPDTEFRDVIGLGLSEALQQLLPEANMQEISNVAASYRQRYLFSDDTPAPLFDGVVDMLEKLEQQGYWLAIATGKGREGLDQALQQTGLQTRFHMTRCASETRSKPHPQMLEEILDGLGADAHEALMIGDTEYDLQMASNASMASLGVSYGVHDCDRLNQHQPIACIDHITQLKPLLDGLT